jgi:GTP cyclohydrolase I
MSKAGRDRAEELIRAFLEELGEDPNRDGLLSTPRRVSEAFRYFTQGYQQDVDAIIRDAVFEERQEDMVMLKDIDFYSLCEHHLVPFFGRCHIAYIPNNRIIGLSKLARIVDVFARRLQVQERMTREIAQAIERHLGPAGVAVVIEAQHLCMMMRGAEKPNSAATTTAFLGRFQEDPAARTQLYNLLGGTGRAF